MPSFWSAVPNRPWNRRRSNSTPCCSVVSNAALTISLVAMVASGAMPAMAIAVLIASSISAAAGTTRATNPDCSASAAPIIRPVSDISIALALPMARVRRCDPPMPGVTASLISGCPNFAPSPAMMKSAIIASSHPPPSAKPLTAAIQGLRVAVTRSQPAKKLPPYMSAKPCACISLMSAPAANAFSLPVRTRQRWPGSASYAAKAWIRSARIWLFSAFSACGRLSVISVTASRCSTRMVS